MEIKRIYKSKKKLFIVFKIAPNQWVVYPNLQLWDMNKDLIGTFLYKASAMEFTKLLEKSVK